MANGFPLSAVVGRSDVMRIFEQIFFSFTFGGEAVSLAASLATIRELERREGIPKLWDSGRRLQEGTNRLLAENSLERRLACVGSLPGPLCDVSKDLNAMSCYCGIVIPAGGHPARPADSRKPYAECEP